MKLLLADHCCFDEALWFKMSEVKDTETSITSCASCGIVEVDGIKSKHEEEACKIRAAELRDELLFKEPDGTHLGDCPICYLPLSYDPKKSSMFECCSKTICLGCGVASRKASVSSSCPFCRKPIPKTVEDAGKLSMKRIKANDPEAMIYQGVREYWKGNYDATFELFSKAAELGHASAHFRLAGLYLDGKGVDKDREKEIYHLEEAAIGGHPHARHNLGCEELEDNNNIERGVKHFMIAAAQGVDESIKSLMELFKKGQGYVSKEDLTTALRAHQAAVDATKSPQREAAERMEMRM